MLRSRSGTIGFIVRCPIRQKLIAIGGIVTWNQIVVGVSNMLMLAQLDGGIENGAGADGNGQGRAAQSTSNPQMQLMLMLVIGIFFYLIVIRPQMRARKQKQKKHEQLVASLKKNDRIVTIGGIIGTVAEVTDDRVTIKIDDNTRMKLLRSSIQDVVNEKSESE